MSAPCRHPCPEYGDVLVVLIRPSLPWCLLVARCFRVAALSEPMPNDSSEASELKERVRQGRVSGTKFRRKMVELRRSGKDRVDPKQAPTVAAQSPAATVKGAVNPSHPAQLSFGGRESQEGGRGDPGKDPGTSGLSLRRNVSGGEMIRRLGERLGWSNASARTEQGGLEGSPVLERSRTADTMPKRRSPRRGTASPRAESGSDTGGSSGATGSNRRPWSLTSSSNNPGNVGRLLSSPASPDRAASSQGSAGSLLWGQPPSGGAGAGGTRQMTPPFRAPPRQEGRLPAASQAQAEQTHTAPLTASDADNMSSVSNTSTVLTDLSHRLEKIEDMLARLLEAKADRPSGALFDLDGRFGRSSQTLRSDSANTEASFRTTIIGLNDRYGDIQLQGRGYPQGSDGNGRTASSSRVRPTPGDSSRDDLPRVTEGGAGAMVDIRRPSEHLEALERAASALAAVAAEARATSGDAVSLSLEAVPAVSRHEPVQAPQTVAQETATVDVSDAATPARDARGLGDKPVPNEVAMRQAEGGWRAAGGRSEEDAEASRSTRAESNLDEFKEEEDPESSAGDPGSPPVVGPQSKRLSTISESPS